MNSLRDFLVRVILPLTPLLFLALTIPVLLIGAEMSIYEDLSHQSCLIRLKAFRRFEHRDDPRILDAFLKQVNTPPEACHPYYNYNDLYSQAANALINREDPRVIEPLISRAKSDHPARWRIDAIKVLGKSSDERARTALVETLASGNSTGLREAAATSLGEINDHQAVGALVNSLTSDESYSVRIKSAAALGVFNHPLAIDTLVKTLAEEDTGEKYLHQAVIHSLGRLKAQQATPYLIDILRERDVKTLPLTVQALGSIGDQRAVSPLMEALTSYDKKTRIYVISALDIFDGKHISDVLTKVSREDKEPLVRFAAKRALEKRMNASDTKK